MKNPIASVLVLPLSIRWPNRSGPAIPPEERLADEQREPEDRSLRIGAEGGPGDLREREPLRLAELDLLAGLRQLLGPVLGPDGSLDLVDDPLRLLLAAVDEEPSRALGDVATDEQDPEAEQDVADARRYAAAFDRDPLYATSRRPMLSVLPLWLARRRRRHEG
jgi:hypothetical protein